DEHAGLVVEDEVDDSARRARDGRLAVAECLDEDDAEALGVTLGVDDGREDEGVAPSEPLGELLVRDESVEAHSVTEAERGRLRLEGAAHRPVSDDAGPDRTRGAYLGHRLEKVVDALPLDQSTGEEEFERSIGSGVDSAGELSSRNRRA